MKTNKITTGILAIALLLGMSLTANAQRGPRCIGAAGQGQGLNQDSPMGANCAYLQLNDEQKADIAELRVALTEKNIPLRNQLGEMRAKMQSLRTGDNQDLKAINSLIDEMSKVQVQVRKNAVEHQLAVRALLTDDQKVMFDARKGSGKMTNRGNRGNRGNCVNGGGMMR